MVFQQATERTVKALQGFWEQNNYEDVNHGTWVPTEDKYPVVLLRNGRVVMAHTDFSVHAICDSQLRGVIVGYERLQGQILTYAASAEVQFMRATRDRLWGMLSGYNVVAIEPVDHHPFEGMVEKLQSRLGSIGDTIAELMEITSFPNLEDDQEFFELVVEALGFNPKRLPSRLQGDFLGDFMRYAEIVHKLLLVDLKIEQLERLLTTLRREQKAREDAQKLWEAERKIQRLESTAEAVAIQHERAVIEASVSTAADMLMALGDLSLSEAAVMGARPDIGARVLAEVLTRKTAASNMPDWLTDPGQLFSTDDPSGSDIDWSDEFVNLSNGGEPVLENPDDLFTAVELDGEHIPGGNGG